MIKYLEQTHTRAINLFSYITEQMNSGEGGDKIFGASGSGAISRSLRQTRTAWSEEDVNNRIVKRVSNWNFYIDLDKEIF